MRLVHSLVAVGVVLALASSSFAAHNTLSKAEAKSGWRLLFDGKSADSWRNFKQDTISDGWVAKDGALTRSGAAGDIISKEQFEAFELTLDYRISKGGNSGLFFHVTEEASGIPWTGPEIQIQDNVDGHDPQKSGWLYQLYDSKDDATRPAGEWNTLHIRIHPDGSAIYMNGVRYARFKKGSPDWDKRVAASKFAKHELFGKPTKGHIALQDHGNEVSFRNIKVREFTLGESLPDPVDGVLSVKTEVAFPNLDWDNWEPVSDDGKAIPLRPIVLTNAGDGSNRIFVATQRGVIHSFANDQNVKASKVFADISDRVSYSDKQNEEGFLGLAFHPKYKETGEFFAFYSSKEEPQLVKISRFRVSKDDPNKADAAFEEEILRIKQPYWNHNGGTIAFGPDGYLYVALGDGGAGNDPHGNGQNLGTLLGSILRIDVDKKSDGKNYAIPSDNPFVGKDEALGEIWANGVRNIWRLSFDRATGALWAADVGQNLWEEINIIKRGGNYGWNLREAGHSFGSKGASEAGELIDPIWEYDHEVGKSITGGVVYRGKRVPELAGAYVYADYVTGKLFALKYDAEKGVEWNKSIPSDRMPVISFGEDEAGDVYFMIVSATGKGIYRFAGAK